MKPLTRAAAIDFSAAVDNVNAEQKRRHNPFKKLHDKIVKLFQGDKEPNPFYSFQYDLQLSVMIKPFGLTEV